MIKSECFFFFLYSLPLCFPDCISRLSHGGRKRRAIELVEIEETEEEQRIERVCEDEVMRKANLLIRGRKTLEFLALLRAFTGWNPDGKDALINTGRGNHPKEIEQECQTRARGPPHSCLRPAAHLLFQSKSAVLYHKSSQSFKHISHSYMFFFNHCFCNEGNSLLRFYVNHEVVSSRRLMIIWPGC